MFARKFLLGFQLVKLLLFATACAAAPTAMPATTAPQAASTSTSLPPTPTPAATSTLPTDSSIVQYVGAIDGAPNPLSYPTKLAVDAQGDIYVTDNRNDRIQKFDRNGKFITIWGSRGTAEGQFLIQCVSGCEPVCPPNPPGWNRCPHLPGGRFGCG